MMFLWQVTRSPTQLRAAMASTLLEYFICRHFDEAARTLSLINGSHAIKCLDAKAAESFIILIFFLPPHLLFDALKLAAGVLRPVARAEEGSYINPYVSADAFYSKEACVCVCIWERTHRKHLCGTSRLWNSISPIE